MRTRSKHNQAHTFLHTLPIEENHGRSHKIHESRTMLNVVQNVPHAMAQQLWLTPGANRTPRGPGLPSQRTHFRCWSTIWVRYARHIANGNAPEKRMHNTLTTNYQTPTWQASPLRSTEIKCFGCRSRFPHTHLGPGPVSHDTPLSHRAYITGSIINHQSQIINHK